MRTSGHTVLITGGASGIGLAMTKQFVHHGNKVIVIGRNERKLKEAEVSLPGITVYACDVSNEEQVNALIRELTELYPDINVLVNNAGIQYQYSFMDSEADEMCGKVQDEIDVNLVAPIQLTARLLPLLSRHDEAAIINISSGLGLSPKKSAPVYCATKAGLHLFTKALRYQLASTTISVFEIIPPLVDTDMTKGRGSSKISTDRLVDEFWRAFRRNQQEVLIGKVKLLKWISRFSPSLADAILKNS